MRQQTTMPCTMPPPLLTDRDHVMRLVDLAANRYHFTPIVKKLLSANPIYRLYTTEMNGVVSLFLLHLHTSILAHLFVL